MDNTVKDCLKSIAKKTADRLVKMYASRNEPKDGMIFPLYRERDAKKKTNKWRISEQEARLSFVIELEKSILNYGIFKHYSVETPTRNRYSKFAKNKETKKYDPPEYHDCTEGGCSGSIDLSIYKSNSILPDINIEFKSGTSVLHEFEKDLLKLYAEKRDGVWFHMFVGNEKTLTTIKDRIKEARDNILKRDPGGTTILVIIVSLDPKKSDSKAIDDYTI